MPKPRIRSPSLEIVSYTPRAPTTQPANVASASDPASARISGKKRKSTDGPDVTTKAKKAKNATAEEPKVPAERWKWINLSKPEIKFKGTKIEAFNCGGTFFKTTAKTLEMRLDKLQVFYSECQGDETRHSHYGYPELCKPKVKARKEDAEVDRWNWINRCQTDMLLKGTSIEAYNCGGRYFRATGKTIEDRLDKLEKFLNECEGDETNHPNYGY
ncbi:hypothetical protein M413DRAFT_449558 [Hebeloma cylindrosporum]|uniref:Uncharacterized protein n=1 Tax=Hebeloma cylindrosporum TaxID=76867 RepID=A0A0C3BV26_HEBCY|nr:hypothetical protein M413DRAFT_449558 [Hebeloma cylindrosporum h7]